MAHQEIITCLKNALDLTLLLDGELLLSRLIGMAYLEASGLSRRKKKRRKIKRREIKLRKKKQADAGEPCGNHI